MVQFYNSTTLVNYIGQLHWSTTLVNYIGQLHWSTTLVNYIGQLHWSNTCRDNMWDQTKAKDGTVLHVLSSKALS